MKAHDPAYLADAFLTSALTMIGELHAQSALSSGKETWTGGWEDPTTGLDALKKRKISVFVGNRTTIPWLSHPQLSHYTD